MKVPDDSLFTPIYVKTRADMAWPEEPVFYLLTADGLFLCRNHPFFRSSVPARAGPSELAPQGSFLRLRFPKVPQRVLESAVGFFAAVAEQYGAEAAVLLAWDKAADSVYLIVPDQHSTVSESWSGRRYPHDLHYEAPATLPKDCVLIGDIHCHVDALAFSSVTDIEDENYRPGLHIVVGRIGLEPPDFHIEANVDGVRFTVAPELVFAGYRRRARRVPQWWLDKVNVEVLAPYNPATYPNYEAQWYDEHPYVKSWNDSRDADGRAAITQSCGAPRHDRSEDGDARGLDYPPVPLGDREDERPDNPGEHWK